MIDFFGMLSDLSLPLTIGFLISMIVSMILQAIDNKNIMPKYTKLRIYVAILGIAFLAILFFAGKIHGSMMIDRIKKILVQEINSKSKIYLDKKLLTGLDASIILKELQSIKSVASHNSIPTKYEFSIDIEYQNKFINFRLEQDDQRAHEYWVHTDYFKNDKRKYNYVGRIYTDYFDIWTKLEGKNFY